MANIHLTENDLCLKHARAKHEHAVIPVILCLSPNCPPHSNEMGCAPVDAPGLWALKCHGNTADLGSLIVFHQTGDWRLYRMIQLLAFRCTSFMHDVMPRLWNLLPGHLGYILKLPCAPLCTPYLLRFIALACERSEHSETYPNSIDVDKKITF